MHRAVAMSASWEQMGSYKQALGEPDRYQKLRQRGDVLCLWLLCGYLSLVELLSGWLFAT